MKSIKISKEIPEIGEIITITEQIDHLEFILDAAKSARNRLALQIFQKLTELEEDKKIWLGDKILVNHQGIIFLAEIQDEPDEDPVIVSEIEAEITIKDKQTKGRNEVKDKS